MSSDIRNALLSAVDVDACELSVNSATCMGQREAWS